MKYILTLSLVGALLLSSCNEAKKIRKESEAWRQTTLKLANQMKAMADDVAKAVPGERYQRLIEQANSADPKVSANAKAYIKRLFHLDIDADYVLTVSIETKDINPINIYTFQAATLFRDEIVKK